MKAIIFPLVLLLKPHLSSVVLCLAACSPPLATTPSQACWTATCLYRDFNTHQHHMAVISSETSRQMTDRLISWQADKADRWYGDDVGAAETEDQSAPEACVADGPPWNARTVPICSQASLLLLLLLPLSTTVETQTPARQQINLLTVKTKTALCLFFMIRSLIMGAGIICSLPYATSWYQRAERRVDGWKVMVFIVWE